MQKIKKAGEAVDLTTAFLPEAEQTLLSHVEMCYSVALALTRNPALGQRLARATLLWAWRRQAETGGFAGGDLKMALLKDLRSRFLNDYYPACSRDTRQAAAGSQAASRTRETICAFYGGDTAEIGAGR